jgi:ABC-type sulfate transport system permease subunit
MARVSPNSGTGSPTGSVTFSTGATTLGASSVASGSATFTTSSLPIGAEQITAAYSGDANYNASTSAASTVDVAFTGTVTVTASDSIGDQSSTNLSVVVQ